MGLFDIGGSIISSALSFLGGERRNESQEDMASAQMAFQERMSNTSYQRAVKDLQAAGLNPMLAYAHGGATTPTGSMANIEDTITPAVNTGRDVYRATTEAAVRKEQVSNIAADTGLKSQETIKSAAETSRIGAEEEKARSEAALNLVLADKAAQDKLTSAASMRLMDTQGSKIVEEIKKIAPEIKVLVSQERLNYAQRERLLAELPRIAAEIPKIHAETEESHQRRLLDAARTFIESMKGPKARAEHDLYQPDGIGTKADRFRKGASVVPGLNWLFKGE